MADTSDIKKGICILFNNQVNKVMDFQHVKPGKGPAFVRTKLKNLENGKIIDYTFSSGHKIELVRVEHRECQYLYPQGDNFIFMDTESFDQFELPAAMVEHAEFLKRGNLVTIVLQINGTQETPISCDLPTHIVFEVTEVEPAVKGNTATHTTKKAKVETGAEVNVPLFINVGDLIKVNTETREYMERVSK